MAPSSPNLGNGPLSGVKVLEIGSTVAGPFCGRLLADFGAEVIKVEAPAGDTVRVMGKRLNGRSLYAASIFRNKALVSIDLHRTEGQRLIRELAAKCDVLVENFRPGALEKWGIGYADLSAINPRLVMVRISGFGQSGPYAQRPGFGVIGEAVSGLRHLTGDPDRPPARVAVSLTDYITGLYAAFGATLALLARGTTGRGQYVDAALFECAFSFMEPHIPAFEKLGHVANRAGPRLPDNTPNSLYPTRDQNFIHIAAIGEPTFRRLLGVMQRPELADDVRFRTAVDRSSNEDALDGLIADWTSRLDLAEVEAILVAAQVPASRIFTIRDIFADPHYRARKTLVDAPDHELGSIKMAAVTPRLSETPGRIRHAGGGVVGGDTRSILRSFLGMEDAEINELQSAGVVLCQDGV